MIKFSLIAATAALMPVAANATTLVYNDFSDTTGLQINGNAAAANDGARDVLRVTPATSGQSGSVFSTSPITFAANYSFSTRFTFNFNNPGNGGADGLVFVIQPFSNTTGGAGGGIGYQGIGNSLGVEFDNWDNGGVDNNSSNHVGIDLNGNIGSVSLIQSPFDLDSGQDLTAWIDYNGVTQTLEVRFNDSNSRPMAALLSYNVDLASVVGNPQAYVGFTSGTGAAWANHDLVNWEFRDTFRPIGGGVPEPATWAMLVLGFGALGAAMRRRSLAFAAA